MKIFAKECLREIRMKKGFSITGLAETVSMTKQALGQIERRENGISPPKSRELLDILGVEFDDVFELRERDC